MSRFRIGVPLGLHEVSAEILQEMEKTGIRWIEVKGSFEGSLDEAISVLRKRGSSLGLSVHAPFEDLDIGSANPGVAQESLRQVRRAADFALAAGADILVVHPGSGVCVAVGLPGAPLWSVVTSEKAYELAQKAQREAISRAAQALRDLSDYIRRSGSPLRIGVENLVYAHQFVRSPQEVLSLIHQVDRINVGATLDVAHGVVCGYRPQDFLAVLGSHIIHVHVNDTHGSADEHLPVGEGVLDFAAFRRALESTHFEGAVVQEYKARSFDEYVERWERTTQASG